MYPSILQWFRKNINRNPSQLQQQQFLRTTIPNIPKIHDLSSKPMKI